MRISETDRWPVAVLWLAMALQAALTLCYSITLHYSLKSSGFDATVYEQLLYNLLHGHGLTSTIVPPYTPQPWLGFHFSPILYLLAPFYVLCPHIETLLAIGSASVALAAWPLYLTARTILGNHSQALLFALIYLFSPFVVNGVLWDFHEVDVAPLCIAGMLWATVHQKPKAMITCSILLLGIKEHYGLSVAGFGLLWAWQWRKEAGCRFGLLLAACGIAALLVVMLVAMPHFNPSGKPAMMDAQSSVDRFSWLGSVGMIRQHFGDMVTGAALYAAVLLLPMLFLPLGSPFWLLPALADAAANALSMNSMMRSSLSYHSMTIIPVLLIACCQTLNAWFRTRRRFSLNDMMLAIVVASFCFSDVLLALPDIAMNNAWELSEPRLGYNASDGKAVAEINALIPKDAAVAAQHNVLPHLAVRYDMAPFPPAMPDTQYIVINLTMPFQRALSLFGIPYGSVNGSYFADVDTLLHDPNWAAIYYSGRWVVMQKGGSDVPEAHQQALAALDALRQEYWVVRETIIQSRKKPQQTGETP